MFVHYSHPPRRYNAPYVPPAEWRAVPRHVRRHWHSARRHWHNLHRRAVPRPRQTRRHANRHRNTSWWQEWSRHV